MQFLKLPDDESMEASVLSIQIETAQNDVEEKNFVARKKIIKYDDVMNGQRMMIYEQRNRVLHGEDLAEDIREEWLPQVISNVVSDYTVSESADDWELGEPVTAMETIYGHGVADRELKGLDRGQMVQGFRADARAAAPRGWAQPVGEETGPRGPPRWSPHPARPPGANVHRIQPRSPEAPLHVPSS